MKPQKRAKLNLFPLHTQQRARMNLDPSYLRTPSKVHLRALRYFWSEVLPPGRSRPQSPDTTAPRLAGRVHSS
jgi:hypothetical protein